MHSESDATKNTHLKKTFLKSQVVKGCGFIFSENIARTNLRHLDHWNLLCILFSPQCGLKLREHM